MLRGEEGYPFIDPLPRTAYNELVKKPPVVSQPLAFKTPPDDQPSEDFFEEAALSGEIKPPKRKIHKADLLIWLGIGIMFILFLATRYYRMARLSKSLSIPPFFQATPTPNPTADWKTHRSEKFMVELKYPPDWELHDSTNQENPYLQIIKRGPSGSELDWTDGSVLSISMTDSIEVNLEKEFVLPHDIVEKMNPKVFSFNGWQGYRHSKFFDSPENRPENYFEEIIATNTSQSGKIFRITWSQMNANNGLTAEKYLFPILSSFKFLDEKAENAKCAQDSDCQSICDVCREGVCKYQLGCHPLPDELRYEETPTIE